LSWVKVLRDMVISFFQLGSAALVWTNMPAALTEFREVTVQRTKVDLTNYKSARLIVNVDTAGFAGASLRLQYSLNEADWSYLDGATGPDCDISATGVEESTWVTLEAAAKDDVYLRLVGINGDGIEDPKFGSITAQFK